LPLSVGLFAELTLPTQPTTYRCGWNWQTIAGS